jgi:hypothetical protein
VIARAWSSRTDWASETVMRLDGLELLRIIASSFSKFRTSLVRDRTSSTD